MGNLVNQQSKLLSTLEALPRLQCRISERPVVSSCPVDELLVDRLFERVLSETPRISVICSVQHEGHIAALPGLMQQRLPFNEFEVIVVDSIGTVSFADAVNEIVAQPGFSMQLRALRSVKGGRALAHNIGVRLARSNVLVFLGDDFAPPETFLDAHLKFHQIHCELTAVGIGAGLFPGELRDTAFRRWLEDSGSLYGIPYTKQPVQIPQDFFFSGNSSVKKELIENAGYFDEDFKHDAMDDYELSRRLAKIGSHSGFVTGAECLHQHSVTFIDRCTTMKLAGEAACVFDCKYPGAKSWHADFASHPAKHRAIACMGMVAYLFSGDRTMQHRYWNKFLKASFIEGYLEKLRTLIEI
ncbi:hypothetical protein BH10CYA1_BH10CYA1_54510 [soil metagenome]